MTIASIRSHVPAPMTNKPFWQNVSIVVLFCLCATRSSAAEPESVETILGTSTSFEFANIPLIDALASLEKSHRIPLVLHERSLAEAKLRPNSIRVSGQCKDQPLAVALSKLLQPHQLAWFVRHDAVLITSAATAESSFFDARVYRLQRNISAERRARSIMANVAPMSWANVGGPGDALPLPPNLLIVYQAPRIQDEVAELYSSSMTVVQAPQQKVPPRDRRQQQLAQPTKLDFQNKPLREVVKELSQRHGLAIRLDNDALRSAELREEELTVTIRSSNIRSLEAGLSLLLELTNEQLRWVANEHEITITTVKATNDQMLSVTYDATGWVFEEGLKPLVEAIQFAISPPDWEDVGGNGSIREGKKPQTLDISQSAPLHRQIARLLTDLQTARRSDNEKAAAEKP